MIQKAAFLCDRSNKILYMIFDPEEGSLAFNSGFVSDEAIRTGTWYEIINNDERTPEIIYFKNLGDLQSDYNNFVQRSQLTMSRVSW